MNDDPSLRRRHADASVEAKRRAAFREALVEADEADVILLSGSSREDWLAQLDQASAGGVRRVVPDKVRPIGA